MSNATDFDGLKIESLSVAGGDISAIVETDAGRVEKKYRPSQLPPKLVLEVGDSLVELSVRSRKNGGSGQDAVLWSAEKDARRCELIDKKIQRTIDAAEACELGELQSEAMEHFDRIAPPPIEGARRLHEQLLTLRQQEET
jgi:hypothetical protein